MRTRLLLAATVAAGLWSCTGHVRERALTLSLPYDLATLNPGARDRLSDFALLSNLYEPLVTTDASLKVLPCLAERWENPDLTTWIFHLRKGVSFHDGTPLTAEDVVYSLQRLRADESLEARRHVSTIDDARADGERRVVIHTRTPLADFLNRIRFIHVCRRGATKEELERKANGTGPYELVSFRRGEEMVLRRSSGYWGPRPAIDHAVIRLDRTADQAVADLESGGSGFVQANSFAAIRAARGRPGLTMAEVPSITVKLLFFDVASERTPFVRGERNPFRDRRVREAIDVGVDRDRLARRLSVPAVPAFQLVQPFIFGYDPDLAAPVPSVERARSLLAEAGWKDGFEATLHTRRLLADGAVALREELAPLGIRLNLELLSEEAFFAATRERPEFVMGLTRFGCPTGDAANFLDAALHTPDPAHGYGSVNNGGYANPEVDGLIEQAARELTPSLRRPLLERIMRIASRDLAWIPLYVDRDVYVFDAGLAWRPRLDNYVIVSEIEAR